MEYHNFDLWIDAATEAGQYPLRASSRQGEADGVMKLRPGSKSLKDPLRKLADDKSDARLLKDLGAFLYDSLFRGDIESLFQASLGSLSGREDQGLRIRLRIGAPEISALPWEYLYTPKQGYFLAASKKTPVSRYLEAFQPIRPLHVSLPLKVLVVIPGESGLDIDKEKSVMKEALSELGQAVQVQFLEGSVTRRTLADVLLKQDCHIFHFIGHGGFDGEQGILLLNSDGPEHDRIGDEIFARFFLDQPVTKLIVLNSCLGAKVSSSQAMVGLAPKLVQRGIPAVVAHQFSVSDEAAVCFTREFYRQLCTGPKPGHVDIAMSWARNQLSIQFPDDGSQGIPVLFMRAPDGMIFDIEASQTQSVTNRVMAAGADAGPATKPSSPPVVFDAQARPAQTPSGQLRAVKKKTLERRLTGLVEEYEAASKQLEQELDEAHRVRLQRRITDLEQKIQEIEQELSQLMM